MNISAEAEKIKHTPNAGGNSVTSEVLSYEMMKRVFGASLLKTEMEVVYFPEGGSITDYTCKIFNTVLGISVTRAMKYKGEFSTEDAELLLTKKLKGVVQSSKNTLEKWNKQILHIWATSGKVANTIIITYAKIPQHLKSNTVLLVTSAPKMKSVFKNNKP